MKKLLFILSMVSFLANAQTNLSGGIYTSETWTLAGSPYIVSGNLVVFEGVEITIEPGVIVQFDQSASLELRGKLSAVGTVTDSITFTSSMSSPSMNDWNGIKVIGTTNPLGVGDQVTMEYVKGMFATTFIDMDIAYHGPYNFTHCYFAQNGKVNEDGGNPSTNFDHCTFEGNVQALDWCQFDSRVSNSYFINNSIGLVGIKQVDTCYFYGHTNYAMAPYGVTTGCTIEYNTIGVKTGFNAVNHSFINNTVVNNDVGMEVTSFWNGTQTFTGNTICNNTTYNLKLLSANNADLGMNCWCSTDEGAIQTTIYDGYDDVSYGLVSLSPVYTNCGAPLIAGSTELELSDLSITSYPNPFTDKIQFRTEATATLTLYIYDMSGRLVIERVFQSECSLNATELKKGIYYFSAETQEGSLSRGKIIKE